jgi:hypothetical protein
LTCFPEGAPGWEDVLARHCADVGRPEQEIERTVTTALEPGESPDRFADRCRVLGELGLRHVVVIMRGRPWSAGDLDTVAGAVNRLA